MIRILIADDHTIMREGLKRILEGEPNIQIVAEAVDGLDALQKVRAGGIDPGVGLGAAEDIQNEFRVHRRRHERVTCTFFDGALTLVAFNDFDSDGMALSDEFSDCLSAYIPLEGISDDGVFEVVPVETV